MPEPRYPIGAAVRWVPYPEAPYYIAQRRWTEYAPGRVSIGYRLSEYPGEGYTSDRWIVEMDLAPWEDLNHLPLGDSTHN